MYPLRSSVLYYFILCLHPQSTLRLELHEAASEPEKDQRHIENWPRNGES